VSKDKNGVSDYEKILNGVDLSKAYDMLIDYVTGLPTLNYVLEEIKTLSAKNSAAVVSVNITSIVNIETIYGWKNFDALLKKTAETLDSMKGTIFRKSDSISVLFPASPTFIIFLSAPRNNQSINVENVDAITRRVAAGLKADIASSGVIPGEYINFNTGFSLINENEMHRVERSLFAAIREAEISAMNIEIKERQKIREDIKNIITQEEVRTVFQPIINVQTSEILAYEALTRGPKTSKYEFPVVLFSAADAHGYSGELEWLCMAKAIVNFNLNAGFMNKTLRAGRDGSAGVMLFLNVDPKTFIEAGIIVKRFSGLVKKYNLDPANIVLEITERTAISDFDSFKLIVGELKKMGFNIAIDDAGAGYSSLQAIAELKPKYLKFDMVLVRDIDKDFIKQELLKTLIDFANKTNSIVIAEGVETRAEYDTVKALGVHYAQGYYFARPAPHFIEMIQIL